MIQRPINSQESGQRAHTALKSVRDSLSGLLISQESEVLSMGSKPSLIRIAPNPHSKHQDTPFASRAISICVMWIISPASRGGKSFSPSIESPRIHKCRNHANDTLCAIQLPMCGYGTFPDYAL